MMLVLAIAAGGALGALLRFWVSEGVHRMLGRGFPYGILTANVLGSVAAGAAYGWVATRGGVPEWGVALVTTGLLGAFTTFSSFTLDTLQLAQSGRSWRAIGNVAFNLVCCIGGAWLGLLWTGGLAAT